MTLWRPQKILIDALLLSINADVAERGTRGRVWPRSGADLQAIQARRWRTTNTVREACGAPDRDASVGLVGGDRHVGYSEGQYSELQHQTVEEIAVRTSARRARVEIVVIENEFLSEAA